MPARSSMALQFTDLIDAALDLPMNKVDTNAE